MNKLQGLGLRFSAGYFLKTFCQQEIIDSVLHQIRENFCFILRHIS